MLYFAEGLPLGIFFDLFPVHMRQSGVGTAEIGLLSLLGLAWTLKFLWAPLVDAWGQHRRWMAGADLAMALSLGGLALHPQALAGGAAWPWCLLAVFTLSSATNDIATDGYTIGLLSRQQFGLANGLRIGFYRVGMLTAGGLLVLASAAPGGPTAQAAWSRAFGLGALVLLVNALCVLAAPRPQALRPGPTPTGPRGSWAQEWQRLREQPLWLLALAMVMVGLLWPALNPIAKAAGWSSGHAWWSAGWFKGGLPVAWMMAGASLMVVAARRPQAREMSQGPVFGAWVELLSRPGMRAVMGFILLFKLGDTASGFMVKPFWVDAGFTPAQIGLVSVNVGLALSVLGGLVGGWYVDRVGIFKGLWVLGLFQALAILGYAGAATWVPHDHAGLVPGFAQACMVYGASAAESFTQGLGTGAFMAFLMGITRRERATTEYAILSSLFAFSRAVAGWAGGLGVSEMGYGAFFLLAFVLSFPAYAFLPAVARMLKQQEQANADEAAQARAGGDALGVSPEGVPV